jgi:hypothetical protein
VKQASTLLSQFAVAPLEVDLSISAFAGSNEDKFNACITRACWLKLPASFTAAVAVIT